MAIPVSVRGDMVEQGSAKQPKDLECHPYAYQLAGATVQQHIAQHESATAHRYPEKPDDFPQDVVSKIAGYTQQDFTRTCRLPHAWKLAREDIVFADYVKIARCELHGLENHR
jgi:ABC-type dipeptide/oligopeptide/nickel transport system ATPase component